MANLDYSLRVLQASFTLEALHSDALSGSLDDRMLEYLNTIKFIANEVKTFLEAPTTRAAPFDPTGEADRLKQQLIDGTRFDGEQAYTLPTLNVYTLPTLRQMVVTTFNSLIEDIENHPAHRAGTNYGADGEYALGELATYLNNLRNKG